MSYFEIVRGMRERVHAFAVTAGTPSYRPLILITRQPSSPDIAVEVVPRPEIQLVSQSVINKLPRIEQAKIEADDFSCNGIPRSFTYDYLINVTTFLVDGQIVNGVAVGGTSCTRQSIREGSSTTWDLILRRKGKRG